MAVSKQLSRAELLRRGAKYGLDPEHLAAALDEIEQKRSEHEKLQAVQRKEAKTWGRALDNSMHRLIHTYNGRPSGVRDVPELSDLIRKVEQARELLSPLLARGQPKPDEYIKYIAAQMAWAMISELQRSQGLTAKPKRTAGPELKLWSEIAAILYGTGKPADVQRTCRSVRDWHTAFIREAEKKILAGEIDPDNIQYLSIPGGDYILR